MNAGLTKLDPIKFPPQEVIVTDLDCKSVKHRESIGDIDIVLSVETASVLMQKLEELFEIQLI